MTISVTTGMIRWRSASMKISNRRLINESTVIMPVYLVKPGCNTS